MFYNYLVYFVVASATVSTVLSVDCTKVPSFDKTCDKDSDCPDVAPQRKAVCGDDKICCALNAGEVATTTTGTSATAKPDDSTTSTPAPDTTTNTKKPASTCRDKVNPKTGVSDCPIRKNLCTDPIYKEVMERQCPKTCKFCNGTISNNNSSNTTGNCADRINPATGVSDCSARIAYCSKPEYKAVMNAECPKTCGFC